MNLASWPWAERPASNACVQVFLVAAVVIAFAFWPLSVGAVLFGVVVFYFGRLVFRALRDEWRPKRM